MIGGALLASTFTQSLLWTALAMIGCVGLLAVLSPTRFNVLATRGALWVDTSKLTMALDQAHRRRSLHLAV